jgi:hypothetical protein
MSWMSWESGFRPKVCLQEAILAERGLIIGRGICKASGKGREVSAVRGGDTPTERKGKGKERDD